MVNIKIFFVVALLIGLATSQDDLKTYRLFKKMDEKLDKIVDALTKDEKYKATSAKDDGIADQKLGQIIELLEKLLKTGDASDKGSVDSRAAGPDESNSASGEADKPQRSGPRGDMQ